MAFVFVSCRERREKGSKSSLLYFNMSSIRQFLTTLVLKYVRDTGTMPRKRNLLYFIEISSVQQFSLRTLIINHDGHINGNDHNGT